MHRRSWECEAFQSKDLLGADVISLICFLSDPLEFREMELLGSTSAEGFL